MAQHNVTSIGPLVADAALDPQSSREDRVIVVALRWRDDQPEQINGYLAATPSQAGELVWLVPDQIRRWQI